MAKRLEYGETPIDNLSHEELREVCLKLYSALTSTACCLRVLRCQNENSPYWTHGMGGEAIRRSEVGIKAFRRVWTDDNIYRAFFRYANDFLFPDEEPHKWMACSGCDVLVKGISGPPDKCHTLKCEGKLREMTREDLKERGIRK